MNPKLDAEFIGAQARWVDAKNGKCNFCRRNTERSVWEIGSRDDCRNLVIRICDPCMNQIKRESK